MGGKKVGVWVLCGVLITCLVSLAQDQARQPETAYLIKSLEGPALYRAYCAVCHGGNGKGGGPMAKSLKAKVPDLTRITERNGGTFPLERIQKIISGEEQVPAGHGTRQMPVWGPIFSQIAWDQDLGRVRVNNLVKYIEALQSKLPDSTPRK